MGRHRGLRYVPQDVARRPRWYHVDREFSWSSSGYKRGHYAILLTSPNAEDSFRNAQSNPPGFTLSWR
jgi:hypothetical protein